MVEVFDKKSRGRGAGVWTVPVYCTRFTIIWIEFCFT